MGYIEVQAQGIGAVGDSTAQGDDELEYRCTLMLSRLEHQLSRLSGGDNTKRMPEILQTAKEMLVEILDTAEAQFDDATLAGPLDRLREVYDVTKQVEKEANQLSLNGLAQMFGFKGGQHNPTRDKYQQLGQDYVKLLSVFFTLLEQEFQTPEKAQEWNESWQGFSAELALRW